jgi:hypothetical protein
MALAARKQLFFMLGQAFLQVPYPFGRDAFAVLLYVESTDGANLIGSPAALGMGVGQQRKCERQRSKNPHRHSQRMPESSESIEPKKLIDSKAPEQHIRVLMDRAAPAKVIA